MYTTFKIFRKCFHTVTARFEFQMIEMRLTDSLLAAQARGYAVKSLTYILSIRCGEVETGEPTRGVHWLDCLAEIPLL